MFLIAQRAARQGMRPSDAVQLLALGRRAFPHSRSG